METMKGIVKDEVKILDENGLTIIEKQREALEGEIKTFEDNLRLVREGRQNFVDQWEIDKEIYEMRTAPGASAKIVPIFKYEENPRYWELVGKVVGYEFREQKYMAEAKIRQFDAQEKAILEQLESAQTKLKELGE